MVGSLGTSAGGVSFLSDLMITSQECKVRSRSVATEKSRAATFTPMLLSALALPEPLLPGVINIWASKCRSGISTNEDLTFIKQERQAPST